MGCGRSFIQRCRGTFKRAESHLGRAEDRDATPEEEMMSEMAALM